MRTFPTLATLALGTLALAACGDTEDASTEAMPDTVEMPAEEALAPVTVQPVEDDFQAGPPPAPRDPVATAPDPVATERAADNAADVAARAAAAAAIGTDVEEEGSSQED